MPDGSSVRRKVASGHGVSRAKWESDDLAAFAARSGISFAEAKLKADAAASAQRA